MKLRPHQKSDIKILKKKNKDHAHILFGASTGYGKSAIIYNAVKKALKKGQRVLVIAPRRKLIKQLAETLEDFYPSMIMGTDTSYDVDANLYVASTSTLHRRLGKHGREYTGKIDLIIIDEVHINFGSASMSLVNKYYWKTSMWLGLSATPIDDRGYRLEGWDYTIYEHQSQKLIEMGWLVPVRVLVEDKPEGLDDIKLTGGDYNEKELSDLMNDSSRVSNIYTIWKKYAKKRKVMIFAVSISHANFIHEEFVKKGVSSAVVHSDIDEMDEEYSLIQFKEGEVDVLINVGKLTTGFDETSVDCLLIARPTKSLRLYIQIIGRGLRLHEGKKDCLILDVAGVVEQNGYPTMVRDFNKKKPEPKEKNAVEFVETVCPHCDYSTQRRNCERQLIETKKYTTTRWYCPNCNEILDEKVVDNRKVERMKEIEDYSDISKVTDKNVHKMMKKVALDFGYKEGWLHFVGKDYKRSDSIEQGMKLIYKKWSLGMINLDTVLRNTNKLRKDI